ncbi:IclR family transcriptional regulator [Patulibacter sp.]|uniref:IclR family transcriptional regulator n=1 Tax=Patulibacter sp. TaxID=1912859 RepID=UPI00271AEA85|nr:IclR family transcriptional regulator [Patulibacter sp.]MDO9408419.1 IclR family transcriptional regulator [Patulibacter sp.]
MSTDGSLELPPGEAGHDDVPGPGAHHVTAVPAVAASVGDAVPGVGVGGPAEDDHAAEHGVPGAGVGGPAEDDHAAEHGVPALDDGVGPAGAHAVASAPNATARRSRAMRLTKDLDLLRGLAADVTGEGLGVVRLATQIGRDKSQVSRSLRALVETGLVERDPVTGRYHLGLELYALAASTAQRRLLSVAPDVLRHLAGQLDETVHLCTLHGIDVLTLRSESPPARATAWGAWEGETAPAHATSAGRVLLAGLSPAALRDRYSAAELAGTAPRSRVQSADDLAAVLAEVHTAGTSVVREEHEEGAIGVSAPVYDFRGERVAAINVSGERRLVEPRLDEVVTSLAAGATRLSRLLGARTTSDGDLPRRPT